jgi:hypothetical protein
VCAAWCLRIFHLIALAPICSVFLIMRKHQLELIVNLQTDASGGSTGVNPLSLASPCSCDSWHEGRLAPGRETICTEELSQAQMPPACRPKLVHIGLPSLLQRFGSSSSVGGQDRSCLRRGRVSILGCGPRCLQPLHGELVHGEQPVDQAGTRCARDALLATSFESGDALF